MIEDHRQTARESIFIWSNLSNDLMELIPSGQMPFTWTMKDPSFKVLKKRKWSICWRMPAIRNIKCNSVKTNPQEVGLSVC